MIGIDYYSSSNDHTNLVVVNNTNDCCYFDTDTNTIHTDPIDMIPSLNNTGVKMMTTPFGEYTLALEYFQRCLQSLRHNFGYCSYSSLLHNTNNNTHTALVSPSRASPSKSATSPSPSPSPSPNIIDDDDEDEEYLSSFSTTTTHTNYSSSSTEYDEGMGNCFSPIRLEGTTLARIDTCDNCAMVILYNMGILSLKLQVDHEALECFTRALFLARRTTTAAGSSSSRRSPVGIARILCQLGCIRYRNWELNQAMDLFKEALHYQRIMSSDSDEEVVLASILNCIGVLHFHSSKPNTSVAMDYFQKALHIMINNNNNGTDAAAADDDDKIRMATYLNNIGRCLYLNGKYNKALEKYMNALTIRRSVFGNDHLDVAATVYNIGQTYHQQRDNSDASQSTRTKALHYYQEFMDIAVPKLGRCHRDIATMLKCMAQLYHEAKHFHTALVFYQDALHAGRASLGVNHPEVASILNKVCLSVCLFVCVYVPLCLFVCCIVCTRLLSPSTIQDTDPLFHFLYVNHFIFMKYIYI